MSERPILFNGAMVRALLAGTKAQTRRLLKFEHANDVDRWHDRGDGVWEMGVNGEGGACAGMGTLRCPFGAVGDRLWVRETWQYADWTEDGYPFVRYHADGTRLLRERMTAEWSERIESAWAELSEPENFEIDSKAADRRWRPSIHMPRWASRLTLEIAGVRVERLQAIAEADAQAEGVVVGEMQDAIINGEPGRVAHFSARDAFAHLWCGINGADAWRANPWVWVVEFERAEAK